MNKETFIKSVNDIRKKKKDDWYTVQGGSGKFFYLIKGYNTWIQVLLKHDDKGTVIFKDSSPMELSVKGFNEYLESVIE